MNFNEQYKSFLIFILLTIITFFVVQKNILHTLSNEDHTYQDGSETIVLGGIIADKYNKKFPKNANMGFISISDYTYDYNHYLQSYGLIKDVIPDTVLKLENINDSKWSNGIAKNFAGFIVKQDPQLTDYIGRDVFLQNGESRIVKMVTHDSNAYTTIYLTGAVIDPHTIDLSKTVKLSGKSIHSELMILTPYLSQYGIQGVLFSELYNIFPSLNAQHRINSLFFALTISALVLVYRKIISTDFAIIFFLTIIFSYWVMLFARNLYWIPFSWFLPAVFSGCYLNAKKNINKILWLIAVYFSFLFKSLAGYEFISSVILFAAAIFVFKLFNPISSIGKLQSVKGFFIICFLGVAGFLTALLIHANIRGDTIFEGLQSIYELDVKRRTYGNPEVFSADREVYASLSASALAVIKTYIFGWKTQFLKFMPGSSFFLLLLTSVGTIFYRFYENHQNKSRDLGLFVAFIMPPLSWFILAKSHSYVHIHINFVLWYLGFAAAIIYISFAGVKIGVINMVAWAKTANPSKI